MTASWRRLVLVFPCVCVAACGAVDDGGEADVVVGDSPLYVASDVLLFTTQSNWEVPVCFTGGTTEARADVRTAVTATWGEWTKLRFTGWGTCPTSKPSPLVPIELVAGTSTSCGGGSTRPGLGSRLTGSTYQIHINYCPTLRGLKRTAVHEMGHAIGLRHEHQRPDRAAAVDACEQQFIALYPPDTDFQFEKLPGGYGYYGSVYDPRSVMNYCRDWDRDGTPDLLDTEDLPWDLSTLDFHAVQQLYGWYDAGYDLPAGAFVYAGSPTNPAQFSDQQHSWHSWGFLKPFITRESAGTYRVDLEMLAASAGNFQVSAFNSANRCKVHNWTTSGTTMQLRVKCRTPGGTAADTQFTAKYLYRQDEPGWEAAYVYSDQPTRTTLYTPTNLYTWSSQGYANSILRMSRGTYRVFLPGQEGVSGDRGTADVTAVGTGSEHCSIFGSDNDDDGGQEVDVKCYTTSGAAADAAFMLSYGHLSLTGTHSFATVNSINATATHTPSVSNQKSYNLLYCGTAPGPSTVTRLGVGRYEVNFTAMSTSNVTTNLYGRSTVKVTGWDLSSTGLYCNPMSWTAGASTKVTVNCYTPGGAAADTRFTASLGTTYNGNCP